MASPAQKYRFSGVPEFTADHIEQLDEMLEDLYIYLTHSPLGATESVLSIAELGLDAGFLTVDGDGEFGSVSDSGVTYVSSSGAPVALTPGTTGAFLRQGTTNPEWSVLILPNAATIGDLLYASAANVMSRLADVATGNALISGGVGVAPAWGKIDLTTHVSGILPMANGGTNNSTAFTTGSVIYFDGTRLQQDNSGLFFDAANNRLGVGVASPVESVDVRGATPDIGLRHALATDYASFRFYEGVTQKAIIQHVGSNFATVERRDDLELFTLAAGADITFWHNSVEKCRIDATGLTITGQIKITGGTPAAGQVLTSDANGLATWEPAAGGGEPTEQTTTLTGTQNDFSLSAAYTVLRCNNATDLTITGFTIGGVAPTAGDRVQIISVGAGHVFLSHQAAGSTAANRLLNWVTSGVTPLAAGTGVAEYQYDDTTDRWRLVSHSQGAAIAPTFNAADYAGDGTITWTVEAADVSDYVYTLVGKKLLVSAALGSTTTGGVTSTELRLTLPNGYTSAKFSVQPARISEVAPTYRQWGLSYTLSGGTTLRFQKVDVSNFVIGANNLTVQFTNTIELN